MTQRGQPDLRRDGVVGRRRRRARARRDARCPRRPIPSRCRRLAERLAEAAASTRYFKFWTNFDERVADWIDDRRLGEPRAATDPVGGRWYRFVPASTFDDPWVDACRSVILLDTLGWPAACQLPRRQRRTSRRASTSRPASTAPGPTSRGSTRRRRSPSASGGLIGVREPVWAHDGTLLAVGASQLLCRPACRADRT